MLAPWSSSYHLAHTVSYACLVTSEAVHMLVRLIHAPGSVAVHVACWLRGQQLRLRANLLQPAWRPHLHCAEVGGKERKEATRVKRGNAREETGSWDYNWETASWETSMRKPNRVRYRQWHLAGARRSIACDDAPMQHACHQSHAAFHATLSMLLNSATFTAQDRQEGSAARALHLICSSWLAVQPASRWGLLRCWITLIIAQERGARQNF
jgi:hypothetical protein